MGKFSLHISHYTKGQICGLERHHLRIGKAHSNRDIKPELSDQNLTLIGGCESLYHSVKSDIESRVTGRVTKSSIWVSEMVFTLPDGIPREKAVDYFLDCLEYLAQISNPQNIKLAVIHVDESEMGKPHLHLDMTPITKDGRLSRKDIFRRDVLRKLHEKFPEYLQSKGWDVQRGEQEASQDYRRTVKELKRENARLEKLNVALKRDSRELFKENYSKIMELYEVYQEMGRTMSR